VLQTDRVVPVIRYVGKERRVGSGYRIVGRLVLTAAHCVRGSGHQVWLADGERAARVVAKGGPEIDLALLEITPAPGQSPVDEVLPTRCARVDRATSGPIKPCVATGYPDFAARPEALFTTEEVNGWIPASSGLADTPQGRQPRFLTLKAEGIPPRELPKAETELSKSPWAGMSGAAVFAGGLLVGVVAEHHLPEGDGSLTVVPVEWAERLADADRGSMLQALGVESAAQMELLAGTRAQPWATVAMGRVDALIGRVTSDVIVGREKELQAIDRFVAEGSQRILVVSGEAGFGKTALLAEWVETRKGGFCDIAYHFFSQSFAPDLTNRPDCIEALASQLVRLMGDDGGLLREQDPSSEGILHELVRQASKWRPERPLALVIDAIDEAESFEIPPVPLPLPSNVSLIVSVRLGRNQKFSESPLLNEWTDKAQRLHVAPLQREAVARYLAASGLDLSPQQVELLHARVAGYPLYLHYLVQDLSQVQGQRAEVERILETTPATFGEYVRAQIDRIFRLAPGKRAYRLLGALAVACAPLPVTLASVAAKMDAALVEQTALDAAVRRWIRRESGPPTTFALDHPLLHEPFADKLSDDAKRASTRILNYGRGLDWTRTPSPYMLRHYVTHLTDALGDDPTRAEDLLAVAGDISFLAAQAETFPDEPSLPAATVKAALAAAALRDDPLRFAEWLHRYHLQLADLAAETPIRAPVPLRAWRLVELAPAQTQPIWLLELAHRFLDEDSRESLDETFGRLEALPLRSAGRLGSVAEALIDGLDLDDEMRYGLRVRLLPAETAVTDLAAHGDIAEAFALLPSVEDTWKRHAAIGELIRTVGEAGLEYAEKLGAAIPKDVAGFDEMAIKDAVANVREQWVRRLVAEGHLDKAVDVAEAEPDAARRAQTVARVARGMADADRQADAEQLFDAARASAHSAEFDAHRAKALAVVAAHCQRAGLESDARAGFEQAYLVARAVTNSPTGTLIDVLEWHLAASGPEEAQEAIAAAEEAVASLEVDRADDPAVHLCYVLAGAGLLERANRVAAGVRDQERRLALKLELIAPAEEPNRLADADASLNDLVGDVDALDDLAAQSRLWISAYRDLSRSLSPADKANIRRRAQESPGQLARPQQRGELLIELGLANWSLGDREAAHAAFCAALEAAAASPAEVRLTHALAELITSLDAQGSGQTIAMCARIGFEQASIILDEDERSAAIWLLCAACAEVGHSNLPERLQPTESHELIRSAFQTGIARRMDTLLATGRIAEAQELADNAPSHELRVRWHISVAAAKHRLGQSATADDLAATRVLVDELESGEQRASALLELARVMSTAGQEQQADRAFEDAQHEIANHINQLDAPYFLATLAEELAEHGRPESARAAYAEAVDRAALDHETVTIRCVGLAACCRARHATGETKAARLVFDEAAQLSKSVAGPHRRAEALTAIGQAASEIGDQAGSRGIFERALVFALKDNSVSLGAGPPDRFGRAKTLIRTTPPSIDILCALAETAAQCGWDDIAEETLDRAEAIVARQAHGRARLARALWTVKGPTAGTTAFTRAEAEASIDREPAAVVQAYCKIADELSQVCDEARVWEILARAEAVAGTMADGPVKAAALAAVAAAAHRAQGIKAARRLFQDAEAVADAARTPFDRVRARIEVADAYTASGAHDRAEALLRRAQSEASAKDLPNVLQSLARTVAARGDLRAATEIAESIDDGRLKSLAHVDVAQEIASQLARAIVPGTNMAKLISALGRGTLDYWTRAALGPVVCRVAAADDVDQAMVLLDAITRDPDNDTVLEMRIQELISIAAPGGHAAHPVFSAAISLAEQIEEKERCAHVLCSIAQAARGARQRSIGLEALTKALDTCPKIASGRRIEILINIATELAQAGEVDRALSEAQVVDLELGRAEATIAVAVALISVGRSADAVEVAMRIEHERQTALLEISTALIEAGHRSDAVQLLLAAADDPAWAPDILAALAAMYPDHAEDMANLLLTQAGVPDTA
jgi:tetratricopeptide (TPR) repeat protein